MEDIGYAFLCFLKGNFYTEYNNNPWRAFRVKMRKIWHILRGKDDPAAVHEEQHKRSQFSKLTRRFLTKFRRSTIQYEINLTGDQEYYSLPQSVIKDEVIPLLTEYEIIKEVETKNSRSRCSRAWALDKYDLQEVFQAEGDVKSPLHKFWEEVNGR